MKRLLLALPLILVASPARAERWVTAASIPYDLDKKPINIVDYQIDVNSIRKVQIHVSASHMELQR